MTALEHLVLESVCRLHVASADEIREYAGQTDGASRLGRARRGGIARFDGETTAFLFRRCIRRHDRPILPLDQWRITLIPRINKSKPAGSGWPGFVLQTELIPPRRISPVSEPGLVRNSGRRY